MEGGHNDHNHNHHNHHDHHLLEQWRDYLFYMLFTHVGDKYIQHISRNPNLTYRIVQQYPDKKWNYFWLGTHPNITWADIASHPDKPWDYANSVSNNPNLTWTDITGNSQHPWNYDLICANKNIPFQVLIQPQYKEKLKHESSISCNPNITWEDIANNQQQHIRWNYSTLTYNPNITVDIIHAHRDKPWDYRFLHLNQNMTLDVILRTRRDIEWNESMLTQDKKITYEDIKKHSSALKWNYKLLTKNPNITWADITDKDNDDIYWDFFYISKNANITWDIVCRHPERKWRYDILSGNTNIELHCILNNNNTKHRPKQHRQQHQNEWDYTAVCKNAFTRDRDTYIEIRMYYVHVVILGELTEWIYHPYNAHRMKEWGLIGDGW